MRYLLLVLLLSACGTEPSSDLIGSYELIEWKGIRPDGSVAYPYGKKAQGMIYYDAKGNMGMQLQKADRPLIGSDDYNTLDSATVLEAYKGFFSYYGSYELKKEQNLISHIISGCKNPDWIGRVLKRKYFLEGDKLTIQSDSVIGMNHILTWERLR